MHHAFLVVTDSVDDTTLPAECYVPSPDITWHTTEVFSIGMVRDLIAQVYRQPVRDEKSIFVINARSIPVEAQQALLKVLEEPPVHVRIYIVVRTIESLLPTVRSRLMTTARAYNPSSVCTQEFVQFQNAPLADRLEQIKTAVDAKDTAWMQAVCAGAEHYAHEQVSTHPERAKLIVWVAQELTARGASKKMLLEELALTVPVA